MINWKKEKLHSHELNRQSRVSGNRFGTRAHHLGSPVDPLGSSACSDRARCIVSRNLRKIDVDVGDRSVLRDVAIYECAGWSSRLGRYYVFSGDDSREEERGSQW